MSSFTPTDRTRLHRLPARGSYDRELVASILDEARICHVGFVVDGQPFVIPTIHARLGDRIVFHGAKASRMLAAADTPISITVTLVDGLVLARSAFHHSMNYRSVVALGRASEITDRDEKLRALEAIVEHVAPGRWRVARPPTDKELAATRVMALPLDEVSAKVRKGGPIDDADDMALPVWAGEIPLQIAVGAPIPASDLQVDVPAPDPAGFLR